MHTSPLSEVDAERVVDALHGGDPSGDLLDADVLRAGDSGGFCIHVNARVRESQLQGKAPTEQQRVKDAAISSVTLRATRAFSETLGRPPRDEELKVASFTRNILDCRIKL